MAAKYLIHAYHSTQGSDGNDAITLQLDDHWFRIPPEEPFEVDQDSNGRQLDYPEFYAHMLVAQYGGIYGLVEIPATKTRTGLTLDVDSALQKAESTLLLNRHRHINLWAQEQLSTRVKSGLPVLPPTGFVEESIKLLNIDLQAVYRITPIGWDYRPDPNRQATLTPSGLYSADQGEEIAAIKAENEALNSKLSKLESLMEQLLVKGVTSQRPQAPTPPTKQKE